VASLTVMLTGLAAAEDMSNGYSGRFGDRIHDRGRSNKKFEKQPHAK
jgi:hypothetical protein